MLRRLRRMSFKKIFRETGIYCSHELKQSFKSWKLVVVLVLYLAAMFGSLSLVDDVQALIDANPDAETDIYGVVEAKFGDLNFAVPFIIAVVVLPFIILVMSFDVLSDERLGNRFRYLLVRSDLVSLLVGKFLANVLILSLSTAIFFIVSGVYWSVKFNVSSSLWSFAYPWFFLTFYSAFFIAFFMLTSSFFKKPFASLALGVLGLLFLAVASSYNYLKYIVAFEYLNYAIDATTWQAVFAFAMLVVLSAFYLSLSWVKLWRSDA
jgi:ABC-type transport system involved in multi-copper enzyme maturation permease subunit